MMNIIAASRLRAVVETNVNTIVGGVASEITTAQEFANKTSLSVSDITNFQIVGDDIQMFITSEYSTYNDIFNFFVRPNLAEKITCYIDFEGKLTGIGEETFRVNQNIILIHTPNNLSIGNETLRVNKSLKIFNSPKMIPVGDTALNNSIFRTSTSCEFITNIANQTINNGSPDADIVELISQGGFVKYKDLTNQNQTTAPTAPTISANTIGSTYVDLNVSQPTHVNLLKYALVFVNGVFNDVYDINDVIYAFSLTPETNYKIKVIIADEYFNISAYSNTINITTTTTPALFQNAVAYLKLDETGGDAIDLVNGYNGTLFGGVTQGVAGNIGTAYSFDGASGYIDVGDNNDFSFTDGTNDTPFTIRCWVNLNSNATQMLLGKAEPGFAEYYFRIASGKISLQLFSEADPNIFLRKNTVGNVIINQWTHIVATYDGSIVKIYQNGVEESATDASSGTYLGMTNTSTSVQISRNKFVNSQFIDGLLDELTIIKGEAWSAGKILDDYNNGIGTTI